MKRIMTVLIIGCLCLSVFGCKKEELDTTVLTGLISDGSVAKTEPPILDQAENNTDAQISNSDNQTAVQNPVNTDPEAIVQPELSVVIQPEPDDSENSQSQNEQQNNTSEKDEQTQESQMTNYMFRCGYLFDPVFDDAVNLSMLDQRGNAPLFKCQTKDELIDFIIKYADTFNLTADSVIRVGNDKVKYSEIAKRFTDEFFEENTLFLSYVISPSGSYICKLDKTYVHDNSLFIQFELVNPSNMFTCDMDGWFAMVVIPDSFIESCERFNAVY